MSESTEVAVIDEAALARLAAMTGADPSANRGPRTPQLRVNSKFEDDDENPLPRGTFYLTDQDQTVYAKTVTIRPLAQYFMYNDYDGDEKKMRNQTVMVTSFSEELLDETGGIRCGRPGGETWRNMDKAAKKAFEDITAFRIVHALVSYEGETQSGEKVTVENVPAVIRLKGANYMGFEDAVVKALPNGRRLWDYNVTASLRREKNGDVTYYVWEYAPDLAAPLAMDIPTFETIEHFAKMVVDHNERVMKKHKKALSGGADDAKYDEVAGSLEDDLD